MNQNEKVSWGTILSVSSVAFGIHVGGGFATGNQTVTYFVKYGWWAAVLPFVAMLILNLVFRSALINAQINKSGNYRQWADGAFAPFSMVFGTIFEICFVIITLIAVATSIAGAGSLLETYGIPYGAGILITSIIFFLLTIFGKELVAKASSIMTICIVIGMLMLCYVGLTMDGADLGSSVNPSNNPIGVLPAVWAMLQYVGYQSYTGATISPYAATLKTKQNVNKMVIVNFVLNSFILCLSTLTLMAWSDKVVGNTLPILEIATMSGLGILRYAYSIVLFMAFISTGVGCTFSTVTRMENIIFKKLSITTRRTIASFLAIVLSLGMSTFGLTALVMQGYGKLGIVGIFIMIIPCLTFIWARNVKGVPTRKEAMEESAQNN